MLQQRNNILFAKPLEFPDYMKFSHGTLYSNGKLNSTNMI